MALSSTKAQAKVDNTTEPPPIPKKKTARKRAAAKWNLTEKRKQVLDLYWGGPDDCRGSIKHSYLKVYPRSKESTAEVEGSKLLSNPKSQEYLGGKRTKLQEKTDITAEWVLEQSVRLFKRCMGEEQFTDSLEIEVPAADGGTEKKLVEVQKTEFNPGAAKGALELIGKNIGVQAFQENVNWKGKLDLSDIMAQAQKRVEDNAKKPLEGRYTKDD